MFIEMCGILSTLNLELEIRLLEVDTQPAFWKIKLWENLDFWPKKWLFLYIKKITIRAPILVKNTDRVCTQTKSVKYFNAIFPWV